MNFASPVYTMTAIVIGASRYAMDGGIKGAKVSIVQDASLDNENRLGKEVLTASAPYDIFEKLMNYQDLMPCSLELKVEMTLMAGGKAGFKVIDANYPAESPPTSVNPNQPKNEKAK